jgi:hypothetical protein
MPPSFDPFHMPLRLHLESTDVALRAARFGSRLTTLVGFYVTCRPGNGVDRNACSGQRMGLRRSAVVG